MKNRLRDSGVQKCPSFPCPISLVGLVVLLLGWPLALHSAPPISFKRLHGTYSGLFYDNDEVAPESSGFFSMRLTEQGAYSATILGAGHRHSVSGRFESSSRALNIIQRSGAAPLTVVWSLPADGSDTIAGTVSDGSWTAVLLGDREVWNPQTRPPPFAGQYTLVVPAAAGADSAPQGDGYGTVSVDSHGKVKFRGFLADGTRVTQRVGASRNGEWPLYVSLYARQGVLLGWVNFTNQSNSDLGGRVSWTKPPLAISRYYPSGFSGTWELTGSRYTPPSGSATPIPGLTDGRLVFSGADLALSSDVIIGLDGKVTSTDNSGAKLNFLRRSGLFTGSFVAPGATRKTPFKGALLQKANRGSGYFLGTNQSGRVLLEADRSNNRFPVLGAIGSQSVNEGSQLTFTATASDPDAGQALTYSLGPGAPTGASINPTTGQLTWTPTEAQGPSVYTLTVVVTDKGTPALSDSETITVTVKELNQPPVLSLIGNKTAMVNQALTFTASATDADLPAQTLTYSLVNPPSGATISPHSGQFSWTPSAAGSFSFTVKVTDNWSPALSDSETIKVTVSPSASGPSLTGPSSVNSGTFTLTWAYSWIGLASTQDGYELQESRTSATDGFTTILNTTPIGDRHSPKSYQVSGRSAGTYWYRVRAHDEGAWTLWSNVRQLQVTLPTNIRAVASEDNLLLDASYDTSLKNKVYSSGTLGVGNNWIDGFFSDDWLVASSALKFDVQSQIANRRIAKATLRLWPTILPADWNTTYVVAACARSWGTTTITSANQPNYYTANQVSVAPPGTAALPLEWDVTAIVRNWASGGWANNGFLIRDANLIFPEYTAYRATSFHSRENYDRNEQRPTLLVEFE